MDEKKTKNYINQFVNNPWVILFFNGCSFIGLILSFIINDSVYRIILIAISALFCVVVGLYLIVRVFSIKRAKRNLEARKVAQNKELYEKIHIFHHKLRDCISEVKNAPDIGKVNFKDKASLLCDQIEPIFSHALETDRRVSVCFKCIKTDSILSESVDDWEIYTLARSSSTRAERSRYDLPNREPDKIKGNTDFYVIVSDERKYASFNWFCCEDLDTYPKEFLGIYKTEFLNSHENPPYKSSIVIPIQIKSSVSAPMIKDKLKRKTYHVLGFLCIDSEEKFNENTKNFKNNTFKSSVQLACAIADSLYGFFETYWLSQLKTELKRVNKSNFGD